MDHHGSKSPSIAKPFAMKKITFRADENLISRAQRVARSRHTTLTAEFRGWIERYDAQAGGDATVDALMRRLRHVRSRGPYTRDHMNER